MVRAWQDIANASPGQREQEWHLSLFWNCLVCSGLRAEHSGFVGITVTFGGHLLGHYARACWALSTHLVVELSYSPLERGETGLGVSVLPSPDFPATLRLIQDLSWVDPFGHAEYQSFTKTKWEKEWAMYDTQGKLSFESRVCLWFVVEGSWDWGGVGDGRHSVVFCHRLHNWVFCRATKELPSLIARERQ